MNAIARPPLPAGMVVDTAGVTQQLKEQQLERQRQAILNGTTTGSVASEANESFASGGGLGGIANVGCNSGGQTPTSLVNSNTNANNSTSPNDWLNVVKFRCAQPTDVPTCYDIQIWSYPQEEAATKSTLQYRQHHAAPYFRVAVLPADQKDHNGSSDREKVVGFVCATRCIDFTSESMVTHDSSGPLLAIHSVVVRQEYRRQGLASSMLRDYIAAIKERDDGVEKVVLIAKAHLLGFYVKCGFTVTKPSDFVHGKDLWYELEMDVRLDKTRLKGYPYYVVDGFANLQITGCSGNPAAVVLLPPTFDVTLDSTKEYMRVVAREFNLSETAFVWRHPSDLPPKPKQRGTSTSKAISDASSIGSSTSLGGTAATSGAGISSNDVESSSLLSNEETHRHQNKQDYQYNIRFITGNGTEIDLCGHATLAAASVLFQTLPVKIKNDVSLSFYANRDVLIAKPYVEGSKSWIRNGRSMKVTLNFPKKYLQDVTTVSERKHILSILKAAFGINDIVEHVIYIGIADDQSDLFVHLTNEAFHQIGHGDIAVNYNVLTEFEGYTRGVIVCCRATNTTTTITKDGEFITTTTPTTNTTSTTGSLSDNGSTCSGGGEDDNIPVDFLSRFFAPKIGINEDHVTGSAHCILGPYFATKTGQEYVRGKQTSRRGGIVECIMQEEDRLAIIGTAVTTMSGSLSI